MSRFEKVSAVMGGVLVGVCIYLILSDHRTGLRKKRQSPPVEELADELKQAWGDRHTT